MKRYHQLNPIHLDFAVFVVRGVKGHLGAIKFCDQFYANTEQEFLLQSEDLAKFQIPSFFLIDKKNRKETQLLTIINIQYSQ